MLIRGMRSLGKIYERNSSVVSDTEEVIRNSTRIDFVGDDCAVELVQDHPEEIFLEASLNPIAIDSSAKLSRDENGKIFEVENIFDSRFFHLESEVKNHFCKSVSINYEGGGYYVQDNRKKQFSGKSFEKYRLDFSDELFEMEFQTAKGFLNEISHREIPSESNSCVFYHYGGFYFYGCHSKQIEPCVCRSVFDRNFLKIKAYTFSSLLNKNMDIRKDTKNYKKVEFAESPAASLYDKIKNGECEIKVFRNRESLNFKSRAVSQIAGTNLITIKFIKEEKNENHK